MDEVTRRFKNHYEHCFDTHGATAKGADWRDTETANMRYQQMLKVIVDATTKSSMLDVGCGFSGLLSYLKEQRLNIDYSGIDVAQNMLSHSRKTFPDNQFIEADILSHQFDCKYDYVVCNGILTQKLTASQSSMTAYMEKLIKTMFEICNIGIAFNIMTDRVNFKVDNLFYKSPEALIAFCLDNITRHIKIDHAYPMYEYTVYLYKEGV